MLCFRVFFFFSFFSSLLLQGIHKTWESFGPGVCILFMCEPERKIKGRSSSAYQWESSPTGKMRKNYIEWVCLSSAFTTQGTKQAVREKGGVLACDNPVAWPFTFNQWRLVLPCPWQRWKPSERIRRGHTQILFWYNVRGLYHSDCHPTRNKGTYYLVTRKDCLKFLLELNSCPTPAVCRRAVLRNPPSAWKWDCLKPVV